MNLGDFGGFALVTGLSLGIFGISAYVGKKVRSPLLNPLLVSIAVIMSVLLLFGIPLDEYETGTQVISAFLGPATAALAYSIYQQRTILKEYFIPVVSGCLVGSIVSMGSAYVLCEVFGLGDQVALSTIPKSTTAPIALSIASQIGGTASITIAAVIVTGVLGAMLAPTLGKVFRVRSKVAQGVAIGTCSHAVGTSRALEMGELEGAMSGVAIAVSGLITCFLVIGLQALAG
jgi:predicted murein hydrolase (TIGR00659 family)